jgi:hypothetical protein
VKYENTLKEDHVKGKRLALSRNVDRGGEAQAAPKHELSRAGWILAAVVLALALAACQNPTSSDDEPDPKASSEEAAATEGEADDAGDSGGGASDDPVGDSGGGASDDPVGDSGGTDGEDPGDTDGDQSQPGDASEGDGGEPSGSGSDSGADGDADSGSSTDGSNDAGSGGSDGNSTDGSDPDSGTDNGTGDDSDSGGSNDPGTGDDPGSDPAPTPEPTPDAALRGGIVVNEVLPDPNGTGSNVDTDGNGTAATTDEFVELYNRSGEPVELAGLELWDPSAGDWFVVPEASVLQPGAVALIVVGTQDGGTLPDVPVGALAFDADRSRGVINNGGDNVIILDREAGAYVQVLYNGDDPVDPTAELTEDGFPSDAVRAGEVEDWGSDSDGSSLGRNPDGTGAPAIHGEFGGPASPGGLNTQ